MPGLFEGTKGVENIEHIYAKMESNCPNPCSTSESLWELRQECGICDRNDSKEKMLEKAVAILARKKNMDGWFNQCPTASGLTDASESRSTSAAKGKGRNVDLVYFAGLGEPVRLIELKWDQQNYNPCSAMWQIAGYGLAYIFCRIHKSELRLRESPLMNVRRIALEVVGPRKFYSGYNEKDLFAQVSNSLDNFARSKTDGALSMSLRALAFPKEFEEVPFQNGQEVKEKCFTEELTIEGRMVRDAFEGLTPVWPNSNESGE